jgi:Tfp pilus assembly protein PilN
MIRINLISQPLPEARHEPVRLAALGRGVMLAACFALALGWLFFDYFRTEHALAAARYQVALQQVQLARLRQLQLQVTTFERQKTDIDRRINVIAKLESDRQSSQLLLGSIASTVNRTPMLWLTGLTRKGTDLTIQGRAASIDAVADFIGRLRRAGQFARVRMKSADERSGVAVPTFAFTLTAEYQGTGVAAKHQGGG